MYIEFVQIVCTVELQQLYVVKQVAIRQEMYPTQI